MGSKPTGLHDASQPSELIDKLFDQRLGPLARRGPVEGGPPPLVQRAGQGELRYNEKGAADSGRTSANGLASPRISLANPSAVVGTWPLRMTIFRMP